MYTTTGKQGRMFFFFFLKIDKTAEGGELTRLKREESLKNEKMDGCTRSPGERNKREL